MVTKNWQTAVTFQKVFAPKIEGKYNTVAVSTCHKCLCPHHQCLQHYQHITSGEHLCKERDRPGARVLGEEGSWAE